MSPGPTVLEVFNTLLRQLRLSVDYELTGSYDGSTNIGTKIIKAHEERQLQEAVIRTIGEAAGDVFVCERELNCGNFAKLTLANYVYLISVDACQSSPLFSTSSSHPSAVSLSGSFANTLPTYQRSEVMLFIMGKIPGPGVHLALPSTGSGQVILMFQTNTHHSFLHTTAFCKQICFRTF